MGTDLGDRLKHALREWTFDLGGPGFRDRLEKLTPPANEFGVDPYGFDAQFTVSAIAPFLWLYRKYFRVETFGIEKVPPGRVLLISNNYVEPVQMGRVMQGAMRGLAEGLDPDSAYLSAAEVVQQGADVLDHALCHDAGCDSLRECAFYTDLNFRDVFLINRMHQRINLPTQFVAQR